MRQVDRDGGPPKLSICIPTYNFGAFIEATLRSALVQMQPGVEIVVLDSASTDDTPAVVERLQRSWSCIRYVRAVRKEGIDRDLAHAVSLACGEYCWLFSADDIMAAGALQTVLRAIACPHDVFICQHSNADIAMREIDACHPVLDVGEITTFELSDPDERARYFSLALTTEAFFSFMSGLVVRKARWDAGTLDPDFDGSCWAHVARFFALMPRGLRVRYLPSVLLHRRGGNDSFASDGVVRRFALAIDGFERIVAKFCDEAGRQRDDIRRVLRKEFPLRAFLYAKSVCLASGGGEDVRLLNRLMRQIHSGQGMSSALKLASYDTFPVALYAVLRRAVHLVRRLA